MMFRSCAKTLVGWVVFGVLITANGNGAWSQETTTDTVRVVYNASWPPFSAGPGTQVDGILPGLMSAIIEQEMNLSIENTGASWTQAQAFVRRGRVDAMVTVATDARLAYSAANDAVVFALTMRPTVMRGSAAEDSLTGEAPLSALRSLAVCDIVGNGWAENFYKTNGVIYVVEKSVQDCLERIIAGEVDVIVQPPEVVAQAAGQITAGGTDQLITLEHEFARMNFNLLVSNKSELGTEFIANFDTALQNMIDGGSYDRVLNDLSKVGP